MSRVFFGVHLCCKALFQSWWGRKLKIRRRAALGRRRCGLLETSAAMLPDLVLFKEGHISWKKEQKQGFFQPKKNNFITIFSKFSKIFKVENIFFRLCHFVSSRMNLFTKYLKSPQLFSSNCFNVDRKFIYTSHNQSENFAFQGIFLINVQQIYQKRTKFVL